MSLHSPGACLKGRSLLVNLSLTAVHFDAFVTQLSTALLSDCATTILISNKEWQHQLAHCVMCLCADAEPAGTTRLASCRQSCFFLRSAAWFQAILTKAAGLAPQQSGGRSHAQNSVCSSAWLHLMAMLLDVGGCAAQVPRLLRLVQESQMLLETADEVHLPPCPAVQQPVAED